MGAHFSKNDEKINLGMIIGGVVLIAIVIVSLIIYWISLSRENSEEYVQEEKIIGSLEETEEDKDDYEDVSIDIGKSVNEAQNETVNSVKEENTSKSNSSTNTNTDVNTTNDVEESKTAEAVNFTAPVKGEILREFAPDSLVYSETLEEWITHNGVDIKADKTTVVKAAASGTVKAIKNDPRYGLTVIVEHKGGYQTVYANLLTAEYVVEGEEIEAEQTIGTVGNTATFEIEDEYHLHFEMLQNGEYVNPCNYVNF
jgi:murein DD-endopeptidase MepM/ murein hydrolase activator NlpD